MPSRGSGVDTETASVFGPVRGLLRKLNPRPLFQLRRWKPSQFDFITLHYIYIISMTLLGSLLMLGGGGIRYIDALFLASSSCTQAGLNTVNLNSLNTWQQVVIFSLANLTNPIVIHSGTAFIRLYWFRKRFDHIVRESNARLSIRRTKSRAVSFSDEERGVNGREIRVLFDQAHNPMTNAPIRRRSENDEGETLRLQQSDRLSAEDPQDFRDRAARRRSIVFVGQDPEEKQATPGKDVSSDSSLGEKDVKVDLSSNTSSGSARSRAYADESAIADDDGDIEVVRQHDIRANPRQATARLDEPQMESTEPAAITGQDIRFADLPVATRKQQEIDPLAQPSHRRRGSTVSDLGNTESRARNESQSLGRTIASTLLDIGARTMTMDAPRSTARVHHRRPSTSRSLGGQSTTFERATSMLRRRRNSSPGAGGESSSPAPLPYISFQPTIGRNSTFVALTSEQRDELGGIEYRATKTLCWVLVLYFFGFQMLGFVCYIIFIYTAQQYSPVVIAAGSPLGWWSIFSSFSAMNDLGLTLTPDSYLSFQKAAFLLVITSFLIVIGNTGFPCMLRLVIWTAYKIWPKGSPTSEELAFLLDHPRRCFTLLFPSSATWWLFAILVLLNGIDLILFIILDLNNPETTSIPGGYRWLVGLFQAFSTRTAGFTVVNLANLHAAVLVSYMIMMYVSVFPVAISIRRTNVYEERSLGIYTSEDDPENGGEQSFVGTHIRRQLGFDLWYVFLALFLICIVENPEIEDSNLNSFNIFNILFEIISAYGTVGLSLGYPGTSTSFSGVFHTLSKLIVIALEIRGRHRGLPLKLDRAVLLPSDKVIAKEEEDGQLRRVNTMGSGARSRQRMD